MQISITMTKLRAIMMLSHKKNTSEGIPKIVKPRFVSKTSGKVAVGVVVDSYGIDFLEPVKGTKPMRKFS